MAETLISPGVLTIENDQSFVTQQPIQVGAAIIGPTVKGPVGIPTIVTSPSDYALKFGTTFSSGSQVYTYFTSTSAYNYFSNGGASLLVTRVVSGSFTSATASIPTTIAATSASAPINLTYISASVAANGYGSFGVNGITFYFTGSNVSNTLDTIYLNTSSFASSTVANYVATASAVFAFSSSVSPFNTSLSYITSIATSPSIVFLYTGSNGLAGNGQYYVSGSTTYPFTGGTNTTSFIIETLSQGEIMNSECTQNIDGTLPSGSENNIRWQIVSPITGSGNSSGTFSLLIRRGNDSTTSPVILETWGPLSLDPYSPQFIEKVIGNQIPTIQNDGNDYYIQTEGTYTNNSSYIRIKQVNTLTPNYFNNSGLPNPQYTASIPMAVSGNMGGAAGTNIPSGTGNYYENINNTNTQGLPASAYTTSIALLSNQDEYRYNFITVPGLVYDGTNFASHVSPLTSLISNCQDRGDTMVIVDIVGYNSNILTVTNNASALNTSYAATYWPWVKTVDPYTLQQTWVPPSTMIPGVYAFNDSITNGKTWFAPAGTTRGVISNAGAERILPQSTRDTLYESNINPIATFPGIGGVVVYGQKTTQQKASALDRVNVRRLLITLKSYISQVANNLVFEQNTTATRTEFLNQVNPYLSSVQQQQGLTTFRVIMDETNNPPSVIDNNQLVGQIYLQPTRTAEFILLDFNITPTGVSFE